MHVRCTSSTRARPPRRTLWGPALDEVCTRLSAYLDILPAPPRRAWVAPLDEGCNCTWPRKLYIVEIESRQTSRDVISGQSCPLKLWEEASKLVCLLACGRTLKYFLHQNFACNMRRDPCGGKILSLLPRGALLTPNLPSNNEVLHEFLRLIQR